MIKSTQMNFKAYKCSITQEHIIPILRWMNRKARVNKMYFLSLQTIIVLLSVFESKSKYFFFDDKYQSLNDNNETKRCDVKIF